jgi:hypothetical protein
MFRLVWSDDMKIHCAHLYQSLSVSPSSSLCNTLIRIPNVKGIIAILCISIL